jgi:Zn-dependent protease with chaperone function
VGGDALSALDRFVFAPSQLPRERQLALRRLLADMSAGIPGAEKLRLELRQGRRAGANAFALPSGIIVMTDELVALAKDDAEIEAVLAHEIGHQRQRHLLRQFLQDSATALVLAAAIGDVTSLTSLAAAAPTLLLRAKFSRDFEREADDFALDDLARRGIPAQKFADILQRMEERRPHRKDSKEGSDYLSTHPSTRERILRMQGNR